MEVVAAQEAPADEVGAGDAPTEDFEDFDPTEGLVGMEGMDAVTPGGGAAPSNSLPQQPQQQNGINQAGHTEDHSSFAGISIEELFQ